MREGGGWPRGVGQPRDGGLPGETPGFPASHGKTQAVLWANPREWLPDTFEPRVGPDLVVVVGVSWLIPHLPNHGEPSFAPIVQ